VQKTILKPGDFIVVFRKRGRCDLEQVGCRGQRVGLRWDIPLDEARDAAMLAAAMRHADVWECRRSTFAMRTRTEPRRHAG
jgi:hypothetical protein